MKHNNDNSKTKHVTQNKKHQRAVALREICVAIWYAQPCGKGAPEKECPAEAIIWKAEKGILQKKQMRVANALSVKDLEKLNENELKLLPAKDFWDSKKKQWKKNVYGTFANPNSVQMKKKFCLSTMHDNKS